MKILMTALTSLSLLVVACSPSDAPNSTNIESKPTMTAIASPAIITAVSSHSFAETVSRVEAAIEKRPLNLFAKVDHAAGAAKAELSLAPSTLFIFGNPKGGTPLMTRNPQMGIVLPLKLHVYQVGDAVKVSYTDITAEAKSHGLDGEQLPIPNIVKMLSGLAAEVTAP